MKPLERARFARALRYALSAHGDQKRKGTQIPYVSHLLQVAGLVLEHGGDADQAIAGLEPERTFYSNMGNQDVCQSRAARHRGL